MKTEIEALEDFDILIREGRTQEARNMIDVLLQGSNLEKAKGKLQWTILNFSEDLSASAEMTGEAMNLFKSLTPADQESNKYLKARILNIQAHLQHHFANLSKSSEISLQAAKLFESEGSWGMMVK